jgi:hypothetical protein
MQVKRRYSAGPENIAWNIYYIYSTSKELESCNTNIVTLEQKLVTLDGQIIHVKPKLTSHISRYMGQVMSRRRHAGPMI